MGGPVVPLVSISSAGMADALADAVRAGQIQVHPSSASAMRTFKQQMQSLLALLSISIDELWAAHDLDSFGSDEIGDHTSL